MIPLYRTKWQRFSGNYTENFSQKLTKTLAEICLFVNEDFSGDDISKGHKHLQQVLVSKLLGQVVDEQVGAFWTCKASRH